MKTKELELKSIVYKAQHYATDNHTLTNHKYGGEDYYIHLRMVFDFAVKYSYLLKDERQNIIASAWTHDLIEDCRLTYNDIKESLNEHIAEITYALTNEKGKTRKERANDKYYEGIRSVYGASFIKICDRLANATYSKSKKSKMFECYQKEQDQFYIELYHDDYEDMFNELDEILSL